jgi:hypothetical protein
MLEEHSDLVRSLVNVRFIYCIYKRLAVDMDEREIGHDRKSMVHTLEELTFEVADTCMNLVTCRNPQS